MKRPASQYYWGDWRRDTALQACSLAARGLWHEMNCLMHDCEPYGHLCVGPAPMQTAQLARLVGITPKECTVLLAELETAGVFSRTDAGVIYSRRMVRDEALRERRANGGSAGAVHGAKGGAHGSKGGRPPVDKSKPTPPMDPPSKPPLGGEGGGFRTPLVAAKEPPPAFASASASKTRTEARTERGAPGFDPGDATPTPAGLICRALRVAGIAAVNPGHPMLAALLEAGATEAEFIGLVPKAACKRDPFAYLLSALTSQREEAAHAAQGLHRGPLPAGAQPVTVPATDTRGDAYLAEQTQRAKEATRPPKDLLALARKAVRTPA